MDNITDLIRAEDQRPYPMGARELVAMGFRHRRILGTSFLLVLLATLLVALFLPTSYESEAKILVTKDRIDPVVSPGQTPPMMAREQVSEEDLNSEIELLKSDDLLRKVVLANGLQLEQPPSLRAWLLRAKASNEDIQVDRAVHKLSQHLTVEPLKKSNVIAVHYTAADPRRAAAVLNTIVKAYFDKHLEVRRAPGQLQFFEQETEKYRQRRDEAERKLAEFPRQGGAVAASLQRDIAVQKLGDMTRDLQQTEAAIAETKKRNSELQAGMPAVPTRITTQVRSADNPQLMQQLKGTLLTLQLRRRELLQKYQPTYRAVLDVEQQIADTQASIAAAEATPMRDQITERDPAYEWMRTELLKGKTYLRGLEAKAAATSQAIQELDETSRKLNESSIIQQNLLHTASTLEDNYQLYVKKQEEVRIANALDRSKILDLEIAEPPTIPALPTRSLAIFMIGGFILALMVGTGLVFVSEQLDRSFRTPDEVQQCLNLPVLAALPKPRDHVNQAS
jgi:uncharacterized protein involved in exopolysaccharide biosynthesis